MGIVYKDRHILCDIVQERCGDYIEVIFLDCVSVAHLSRFVVAPLVVEACYVVKSFRQ